MVKNVKMKRLSLMVALALVLMALVCIGGINSNAEVYSGYCGGEGDGTNISWELDTESGVLNIFGTGEMADYAYDGQPWYGYRDSVRTVNIGEGITSIGSYTFWDCNYMEGLNISGTVLRISDNAICAAGWLGCVESQRPCCGLIG